MDFHSILNIAQKTQAINEKKKPSGLNTKFTAPKKEQKTKEKKSEAIQKLLEEKEKEKQNKDKARKHKQREEKSDRVRHSKGESSKNKVEKCKEDIKLPEIPLEEVVIHVEDFVKSSSRRREAHNPGFVNRPIVAPVKDEQVIKEERVNTVKQPPESAKTSSKHSSQKPRISSKSPSNSSSASNSSSKLSSKHHKSSSDLSTSNYSSKLSSKHHKSSSDLSTSNCSSKLSSKHHKSSSDPSTSSSKHSFSKSSLAAHRPSSSSSSKDKSQSKAINNKYGVSKTDSSGKSVQKSKPRRPAPPPMDFGALLKLAEQKHKEVPQLEVVKKPVKKEPETSLMTQDEKNRLERTKSKTYKEWLQHGTTSNTPESLKPQKARNQRQNEYTKLKLNPDVMKAVKRKLCSDEKKTDIKQKVAKLDMARNVPKNNNIKSSSQVHFVNPKEKFRTKSTGSSSDISGSSGAGPYRNGTGITSKVNLKEKFRTKSAGNSNDAPRSLSQQSHKTNSSSKVNMNERFGSKNAVSSRPSSMPSNSNRPATKFSNSEKNRPQKPATKLSNSETNRPQKPPPKFSNSEKNRPQTSLQKTKSESGLDRRKAPTMANRPRPSSMGKKDHYSTTNENVLVCGPTRKEESAKSSNPWDRIYGQIQKNRPMPVKRPLEEDFDSEEEDWSDEDDDFIDDDIVDDGPIRGDNYSSHLKEIFGYSYKDKFRNFDDRDTNMVTSFSQQMKEEARSTRLGKEEDLEDMKQELEEIQRKKLAKKKKLK